MSLEAILFLDSSLKPVFERKVATATFKTLIQTSHFMNNKFIMPYDDSNEPDPWYIYDYLYYFSPGAPEDSKYPFGLVYEFHLFDTDIDPTYDLAFLQRHDEFLTQFGEELVNQVFYEAPDGGYTFADAQEDFQFLFQAILDHINLFAQGTWIHRDNPVLKHHCFVACGLFYSLSCFLDHLFDIMFDYYGIDVHRLHVSSLNSPKDLSDPNVNIVQALVHFRRRRQAVLKFYNIEEAMHAFFREDWYHFYGYWK